MPSAAVQLPDDIQALKFRHAIEIDDTSWDQDVDRLIDAIQGGGGRRRAGRPRWALASVAALGIVAIVGLGAWLLAPRIGGTQPSATATAPADASTSPAASVATPAPSAAGYAAASFGAVVFRDDLMGPVAGLASDDTSYCTTDVAHGLAIAVEGVGFLCGANLASVDDSALVSLRDVSVDVDIEFESFTTRSVVLKIDLGMQRSHVDSVVGS